MAAEKQKLRVIIAGKRDYTNYEFVKEKCEKFIAQSDRFFVEEIVSGAAPGVDTLGERWAKEKGYKIRRFKANWDLYQKSAGPIRNWEMAKYANVLVAFWDGKSRGTGNMISTAKRLGLYIIIITI